jgi:hypothetical protein
MGARVIVFEMGLYLLDIWISCEFAAGRLTAKVERRMYYNKLVREGSNTNSNP